MLSCVASLVAIDIIILFLWDIVDPLEVVEKIGVKVVGYVAFLKTLVPFIIAHKNSTDD